MLLIEVFCLFLIFFNSPFLKTSESQFSLQQKKKKHSAFVLIFTGNLFSLKLEHRVAGI